tara:strand:+ start:19233 stop:20069 length:837 start_codon:yes stop_codon:yes gene_type:complete
MTRILAFAGAKQSGKNTCCSFLHGYQMRSHRIIKDFSISDKGELVVGTVGQDVDGNDTENKGVLDVTRDDMEFAGWAAYNMWPFIKHYAFASTLKELAIGLFGLTKEQCYGTDAQKNTLTWMRWENMPAYDGDREGRMSAREFLQYFGTDVCRYIYNDIWTDRTISELSREEPLIAIISDCRFPNEVNAIKQAGGKIIHLTRSPYEDSHSSENALKDFDDYDAVIDTENLDIHSSCVELINILEEWGWLGNEIQVPEEDEAVDTNKPTLVGGIQKIKE